MGVRKGSKASHIREALFRDAYRGLLASGLTPPDAIDWLSNECSVHKTTVLAWVESENIPTTGKNLRGLAQVANEFSKEGSKIWVVNQDEATAKITLHRTAKLKTNGLSQKEKVKQANAELNRLQSQYLNKVYKEQPKPGSIIPLTEEPRPFSPYTFILGMISGVCLFGMAWSLTLIMTN